MRYPLLLPLRPSRRAMYLIAAIHSVAAIAFLLSSFALWQLLAALSLLAASCWHAMAAERAKAGQLLVLGNAGLIALGSQAEAEAGRPLPGCTDFGWAVWLQWREAARRPPRRFLMLLPDSVAPESWRALRTWLRHKAAAAASVDAPADASAPGADGQGVGR